MQIKKDKVTFYGILTVLVGILCYLFIHVFHKNGYVPIWRPDGLVQHFTAFQYTSQYWTNTIKELLIHGRLPETFMNYAIGQGSDQLLSLNAYDFTDPVTVICSVIFRNHLLIGYECMIMVKVWLSAVLFSCFAFSRKNYAAPAVLCGALAYAFCGGSVMLCAAHPNFYNGVYLLPFLLWGVEAYLNKKNGKIFVIAVVVSVLSNYYMMYIDCCILAGYVLLRLFPQKRSEWKISIGKLIQLILLGILGLLLSAAVLFPTVYAFLNNSRLGIRTGYSNSLFFFPKEFYLSYFKDVFVPTDSGYYTQRGLLVLGCVAFFLLFFDKSKRRLRLGIIAMSIMMGIPIFGIALNGFGYVRNLWGYALSLFLGIAIAEVYEQFPSLSFNKRIVIGLGAGLYAWIYTTETGNAGIAFAILITVLCIYLCSGEARRKKAVPILLVGAVMCNAYFVINVRFSPSAQNRVSSFMSEEAFVQFRESLENDYEELLADLDTTGFFRIEKEDLLQNQELGEGYRGTTYWWSIMPQTETDYYKDLDLVSLRQNCNVKGLDGRTNLCALSSVKYYIAKKGNKDLVPYGFEKIKENEKYELFENKYALPLMYAYTSLLDTSYYDASTPLEKQQLLLKGARIESEDDIGIERQAPDTDVNEIEYSISAEDGVSVSENGIVIDKANASLVIHFQKHKDTEAYLWMEDTNLESLASECIANVKINNCSRGKEAAVQSINNNWTAQRDGLTVNLGSQYEGDTTVTITFSVPGEIQFKKMHIMEQRMEGYITDVETLNSIPINNLTVNNACISGQISMSQDGILQLAVPYSKGWTATVDQKKVQVYRSGGMYMAVRLETGEHNIEFTYHTPYMKVGMAVTLLTLVVTGLYAVFRAKKKKQSLPGQGL
ncbi:MAG: YfhO family protein [Eubacteriales bacterium]|nr:YfhO family protein [Eubacteriales bacterium]